MKNIWVRSIVAIAVGIAITASLAVASHFAWSRGAETTANILLWPNSILQALVHAHNIGTPERPLYEGTPLNILAYLASYPFGAIVYAAITYLVLSRNKGRA